MPKFKKKTYKAPDVKEVKLLNEEAVLANCKQVGGSYSKALRCESDAACANRVLGS